MAVVSAGVDTWSIAWYLREESSAVRAMEHLATERAARSKLLPEKIAGHRVGWFPGSRLVFAEGRPGGEEGLCDPGDLPGVAGLLADSIRDRGVRLPQHDYHPNGLPDGALRRSPVLGDSGFAGVRRLDSTVDLRFENGAKGLATLSGVFAQPVPRVAKKDQREVGGHRIETVWFLGSSGRSVLGRWYDKGVETGEAARGEWVRPEDQRRFAKDARVPVDVVGETSFVRDSFVRRFEPLWQASKGVYVASHSELAARVRELVEEGEMTPGEAKAALGHLVLDSGGERLQSRSTWYRDRSVCRRHGLVLADCDEDRVSIDLGEVVEEALEADCWGRG
jgi:hypothetical protein